VSGTILVTGATGGLGRVMVDALVQAGRTVVATGRNTAIGGALENSVGSAGVRFIAVDLAHDPLDALVVGCSTVIHLAALSSPWGPHADFISANVTATQRLLDAARSAGVARFLFASTPSIYAAARDQIGLSESSPLPHRFANSYAATKYAAEQAVIAAAAPGFATVALRPRAIISPHDSVLLPRLLRAAERGVLPLPHGGATLIEPTDARDVVAAFLAAETRADAVSGRAFNLSGGQPLPLADLAAHVFARLQRPVCTRAINRHVMLAIAGALERIARLRSGQPEPVLTRYSAMTLGWSQTFDLVAARDALGWTPRHAPHDAIDWALNEMQHA
jgi:nucleoside-diphosphate-sugar epimerase